MNRKIILISAVIILLLVSGFGIWWQWGGGEAMLRPQASLQPQPLSSPVAKIETDIWQDPAGFGFSYNKLFKVDNHPEDEVNYAHLDLEMAGKVGGISIIVSDFGFKSLEDWLSKDETVKKGSALDTQVAGLKAKKVVLGKEILTGFIDTDLVFYLVSLKSGDDETMWRQNYEKILDSFKLIPLEGEEEDSTRLQITQPESGENNGGEDAIIEEEETIE